MVVSTRHGSLSRSVTGRPLKVVVLLQIEMFVPTSVVCLDLSQVEPIYPLRCYRLRYLKIGIEARSCVVVFQFANDIRAGKKVCYTLSRCPHRLAAKDATLSRWISRVRIPLGAPFKSRSPLPSAVAGFFLPIRRDSNPTGADSGICRWTVCKNGKYEYCYRFSNSEFGLFDGESDVKSTTWCPD